jgi:methyl-accepting chemotaxis protein
MNGIHNLKIWIRLVVGISVLLILAWTGIVWLVVVQQQEMGLKQARDFASSVNQMTVAAMTGMMITGTMDNRAVYLDQIQKTANITSLHLVRGEPINKQFGPGKADDIKPDAVEQAVLASGRPYYAVQQTEQGEILRAVIPTHSSKNYLGKDCTTCHDSPEKTVLGAVSMNISLDSINQAVRDATLKVIGVAVGILVLVIGFVYVFVSRSMSLPLERLSDSLAQIAEGEGDLTRRLKVESQDEIGKTSAIFNTFIERIQSVVADVKTGAEQVMATAQELASASRELTSSSDQQTEATVAMAAAIEEITVSIATVADSASNAQNMAEDAGHLSNEGAGMVRNAVGEMGKISSSVGHSTQMIRELDKKSTEISSIVKVIKEIADQTNLLALNASIEAARAGEQGRGFAVVADEVKKLSERTSESTQEIAKMIDDIQQSTQSSVQDMDLSSAQVVEGMSMAERSGDAMTHIEASTGKVREAVDEISSALREQSAAANQLAQEVEKIAQKTEKNNFLAKHSSDAAKNLEEQALTLKQAVDRFKV